MSEVKKKITLKIFDELYEKKYSFKTYIEDSIYIEKSTYLKKAQSKSCPVLK